MRKRLGNVDGSGRRDTFSRSHLSRIKASIKNEEYNNFVVIENRIKHDLCMFVVLKLENILHTFIYVHIINVSFI